MVAPYATSPSWIPWRWLHGVEIGKFSRSFQTIPIVIHIQEMPTVFALNTDFVDGIPSTAGGRNTALECNLCHGYRASTERLPHKISNQSNGPKGVGIPNFSVYGSLCPPTRSQPLGPLTVLPRVSTMFPPQSRPKGGHLGTRGFAVVHRERATSGETT